MHGIYILFCRMFPCRGGAPRRKKFIPPRVPWVVEETFVHKTNLHGEFCFSFEIGNGYTLICVSNTFSGKRRRAELGQCSCMKTSCQGTERQHTSFSREVRSPPDGAMQGHANSVPNELYLDYSTVSSTRARAKSVFPSQRE